MTTSDPLLRELNDLPNLSPPQRWARLAPRAVAAGRSHQQCWELWEETFRDWPAEMGPRPIWTPSPADIARANLTEFMTAQGLSDLPALRRWSTTAPADFWSAVCRRLRIRWAQPPSTWLDNRRGVEHAVWAPEAALNIVLSCLPELVPTEQETEPKAAAAANDSATTGVLPSESKTPSESRTPSRSSMPSQPDFPRESLDPHRAVLRWQSAGGPLETISAQQLAREIQRLAQAWQAAGWSGRRVAMILPLSPIGVAVYLTALYRGSTVISIADSFSAPEIANRLRLAQAEVVVTVDSLVRGGKRLPLLPRIQQATDLPCLVIGAVHGRGATDWNGPWLSDTPTGLRPQDWDWNLWSTSAADPNAAVGKPPLALPETDPAFAADTPATVSAWPVPADQPIHLLFSSGTTGDPKVIPWTPLTPIKCAADGFFHQDLHSDDVVAWPTSLGWMMGPWLIFATLLNRATMALFEEAPLGADFGRFVQDARVTVLGLVPSIVKTWRANRELESFDWSHIRLFSSTGESSQREDYFYLSWLAGFKPIIEYCGGTEIGGGYITSTLLEPNAPATFTGPAIGLDVEILDANGQPSDEGELYLVPPSLGLSQSLLNRDHHATYYADVPRSPTTNRVLRKHGDHFRRLPGGYYEAGGRTDDTMNLGGIKVSSLELERIINRVPGVRESAAVAYSAGGGPDQLVVFLVLHPTADCPTKPHSPALPHLAVAAEALVPPADSAEQTWVTRVNQAIRAELNPLFKASHVQIVSELPRTASNKILRRTLRDQWQSRAASGPLRSAAGLD